MCYVNNEGVDSVFFVNNVGLNWHVNAEICLLGDVMRSWSLVLHT